MAGTARIRRAPGTGEGGGAPRTAALVHRCLRNDQTAMFELVNRYRDQVYGLCYRMLGHRQDAEDVAQETFVRVLKNLHRWDPQRAFEPWLLAIAGNRCRTALATRKRRPAPQSMLDPPSDDSVGRRQASVLAEEVQLALSKIRPDYRLAFVLFHEQELTYEQIAESLGRPLGTIKTWIHRARLDLIKVLAARGVIQGTRHALR